MRWLSVLVLAGCLEAPTGRPQTWPLDDHEVVAVAAGDFDGDGFDEVFAVVVGEESGIYMIDAATDIAFQPNVNAIQRFSAYSPRTIEGPAALLVVEQSLFLVVGNVVEKLDAELATVATTTISGAPSGVRSLHPVEFPMGTHVAAIFGNDVFHFRALDNPDTGAMNRIPAKKADGTALEEPQLVTGFDSATAVVAGLSHISRSAIPPGVGGFMVWDDVRADGVAWLGQAQADLDDDGFPEILGFDPSGNLCATEASTTLIAPSCIGPAIANVERAALFATAINREDDMVDVVAVLGIGGDTLVELWINVEIDELGNLTGTKGNPGMPVGSQPDAIPLIVQHDTFRDVLVIDRDGFARVDPNLPP